jgi:hypothetical protein
MDERVGRSSVIIEIVQILREVAAMSLAELMPLVESLSQADRQRLMSFLSIQQPEIVAGRSIADCYGICSDDPIVLDDLGISEALDDEMVGAFD